MLDTLAIDISKWQTRIDGFGLKSKSVDLVVAKCSQGMSMDSKFDQHANNAVAAGQMLAAYHWNDPIIPAQEQADFCADIVRNYPVLFVGLDLEQWWRNWTEWYLLKGLARRFSPAEIGSHASAVHVRLTVRGNHVLPYTNLNFVNTYCPNLFTAYLQTTKSWVAQWPYAYQPPNNQKGVFITWENLKYQYVPYNVTPVLPRGVTEALGWQWTGDRWKLPYVYKYETGTTLCGSLDVDLFDSGWLASLGGPPVPPPPPPPPAEPLYSGRVNAGAGLNVRNGPDISYAKVGALAYNTVVEIWEEINNWGKISNTEEKWVSLAWITKL